jgi:Na+/H+ antiporter NhaA
MSPSHRLEYLLHKPVAFCILPIFALANTGVVGLGTYLILIGTTIYVLRKNESIFSYIFGQHITQLTLL